MPDALFRGQVTVSHDAEGFITLEFSEKVEKITLSSAQAVDFAKMILRKVGRFKILKQAKLIGKIDP